MREEEEEPSWFARWEDELPSPEELTPLSQTLITPDLALAFDIPSPNSASIHHHHRSTPPQPPLPLSHSPSSQSHHHQVTTPSQQQQQQQQHQQQQPQPPDFDSLDMSGAGALPADDQARTLKRPRLVWTPQLHKRFVDAVAHLGIKNAVPKTIMQLMSVDGLTRENVASHLQKYRLYLKRMQGLAGAAAGGGPGPQADATEQLFASSPVPQHFLNRGGPACGAPDQFLPFMQVSSALQQQQQIAAAAAAAAHQQQYYHHRHMGHLASPPSGEFEHGFLSRQSQQQAGIHRMVGGGGVGLAVPAPLRPSPEGLDTDSGGGGRKVLTLFPTNDD